VGANVENASYPVGTCAERVAIATAVVAGVKYGDIKALSVATYTRVSEPTSPCGMCRQFIREFCEPKMPIIMVDANQHPKTVLLEDVCTLANCRIRKKLRLGSCYRCRLDQKHYKSWLLDTGYALMVCYQKSVPPATSIYRLHAGSRPAPIPTHSFRWCPFPTTVIFV